MSSRGRSGPPRGRGGLIAPLGDREGSSQEMSNASESGRGMRIFTRGRYLPHSDAGRIARSVDAPEYRLPEPVVVTEPVVVPEPISLQDLAREHIREMEERRRRRPPPLPRSPPQYKELSDYSNYHVTDQARNFPVGHNYTQVREATAPIVLSPEAQAYEESQQQLANELESREKGWGGNVKKKYTSRRQKKQRHRRHRRRHSTIKYRT